MSDDLRPHTGPPIVRPVDAALDDPTMPSPVVGPLSNADQQAEAAPVAVEPSRRHLPLWAIVSLLIGAALVVAAFAYRTSAVDDRNLSERVLADGRTQLDATHGLRDDAVAQRDTGAAAVKKAQAADAAARAAAVRLAREAKAARAAAAAVLVSSQAETQLSGGQEAALRARHFNDYNAKREQYNATYGASDGPYAKQIAALQRLVSALAS